MKSFGKFQLILAVIAVMKKIHFCCLLEKIVNKGVICSQRPK